MILTLYPWRRVILQHHLDPERGGLRAVLQIREEQNYHRDIYRVIKGNWMETCGVSSRRIKLFISVMWRWRCWLRDCATIREVPGSIPGRVLGHFQVTCSFRRQSAVMRSTHSRVRRKFHAGKVRSAPVDDISAGLVVSNVKSEDGSQTFLPPHPLSVNPFVTGKLFH